MPKGLTKTSSTVSIGFSVPETAANTFTEQAVDLNLSPLDKEVFVVQAINIDPSAPDNDSATGNSATSCSLTSTSQREVQTLANSNCLAVAQIRIQQDIGGLGPVLLQQQSLETPPATMDYVGIIATNDFFVQVEGLNNTNAKGCSGKLYGYRARADADVYAALVQSEALSA